MPKSSSIPKFEIVIDNEPVAAKNNDPISINDRKGAIRVAKIADEVRITVGTGMDVVHFDANINRQHNGLELNTRGKTRYYFGHLADAMMIIDRHHDEVTKSVRYLLGV